MARTPLLPLDVSYVDKWEAPPPPRPAKKIWPQASRPMTDPSQLLPDWSIDEPDLFDHETEAQIERCHSRIAQNIFPELFEQKLKEFIKEKSRKEYVPDVANYL
ncbi:hypothetical protein N7462_010372 [Penicillium macrosclerotiorum]|uniref:uncharacterized protein n=1 Tax=Penicillium macrosclerotiorum TaxID=303699 RepID=UPI002547FCD2|nr:uncharacterized protein N7462_010372 [Penicillium macrosclerotiorum]KAJ5669302.1 hypothetical protein N7462_010372 [Penicillium macrosclerotiorum]